MARDKMAKTLFVCQNCGFSSVKWLGRCPECGQWDSLEESAPETTGPDQPGHSPVYDNLAQEPMSLGDISPHGQQPRFETGIRELDQVLGGGLVPGSMVLLGGEPGIGKSTLLLQALSRLSESGLKVLYASGEESAIQIRLRADRLDAARDIIVICNPELEGIISHVLAIKPDVLAIDSIQTLYTQGLNAMPGSIGQIRSVTSKLMHVAKALSLPVLIVGHVTKEGAIAGPRALEHLVDTVLYFEGDRTQAFRILRTVKNRFGPTHEIGVFEMGDKGLKEVSNPSNLFVEHRQLEVPGSVIFPCIEGTRPILMEIQVLVNQSYLAMPRRTTAGIDSNRLALLTAVAEKVLGLSLYDKDIFVNVAGGLKISEPASDLPLVCSIVSSLKNQPIPATTAIFGEVGLAGEVRPVSNSELRIKEIHRLGLDQCLLPKANVKGMKIPDGISVHGIDHLSQLHEVLFQ